MPQPVRQLGHAPCLAHGAPSHRLPRAVARGGGVGARSWAEGPSDCRRRRRRRTSGRRPRPRAPSTLYAGAVDDRGAGVLVALDALHVAALLLDEVAPPRTRCPRSPRPSFRGWRQRDQRRRDGDDNTETLMTSVALRSDRARARGGGRGGPRPGPRSRRSRGRWDRRRPAASPSGHQAVGWLSSVARRCRPHVRGPESARPLARRPVRGMFRPFHRRVTAGSSRHPAASFGVHRPERVQRREPVVGPQRGAPRPGRRARRRPVPGRATGCAPRRARPWPRCAAEGWPRTVGDRFDLHGCEPRARS